MGGKILIVDDEPSIVKSVTRLLRPDGYEIFQANSGAEGLQIVEDNDIQVIISDQRMPEMEGSQFLSSVHKKHPEIMKMILSGYTDFHGLIEALNEGAIYKFINKPWDGDELRSVVREAFQVYEHNSSTKIEEVVAASEIPTEKDLKSFFSDATSSGVPSYSSLAIIESKTGGGNLSALFPVLRGWSHNKSAFPCVLSDTIMAVGMKGLRLPEEGIHFFNDLLLEIEHSRDLKEDHLKHVNIGIGWSRESNDDIYEKLLIFAKSALEQQRKSSLRITTRPLRDDSLELNNFLRFMNQEAGTSWNIFGIHMPLQYLRSVSKNPTQKLLPRLLFQSLFKNYQGVSVTLPKGDFFAIIKNINKAELSQVMQKLEKVFTVDERHPNVPENIKRFRAYDFAEHRVSFTNLVKKSWPSNEANKAQAWKLIDKLADIIDNPSQESFLELPVFDSQNRKERIGAGFFCQIDLPEELKLYYKATAGMQRIEDVLKSNNDIIVMDFSIRPILEESGLNIIYKQQKTHKKRLEFLIKTSDLLLEDIEHYETIYNFLKSINVGVYVDNAQILKNVSYDGVYKDGGEYKSSDNLDIFVCEADRLIDSSINPAKYIISRHKKDQVAI